MKRTSGVVLTTLLAPCLAALAWVGLTPVVHVRAQTPGLPLDSGHALTGHTGVNINNNQGPPDGFGYGFGYYTLISELTQTQAANLQLGWGSWMIPNNQTFTQPLCPGGTFARDNWPERGPTYRDVYQTIEGGTGVWGSTRFPFRIAKWRVNSTPDCYSTQIASTGWTFGGDALQADRLGLVQLSNRLLVPPDGLVFKDVNGAKYLGHAWMALPLLDAGSSSLGVPTGDQSWTLFLRTDNFKGPAVFFTPETWSRVHKDDRSAVSRGHDTRPMLAGGVALEMGNAPVYTATDASGKRYRRIPRLSFPQTGGGESLLIHDIRFYSKAAIWNGFANWKQGGSAPTGFDPAGANTPTMNPGFTSLRFGTDAEPVTNSSAFMSVPLATPGGPAFGFRWQAPLEAGIFPEYFEESGGGWRPVPGVPAETKLADQVFPTAQKRTFPALNQSSSGPWTPTKWFKGLYSTTLGDGSIVLYTWYKFTEQPAIARLNLPSDVLARLQTWAESLHEKYGLDGATLASPTSGSLVALDDKQIVTPPKGIGKGYVPIVISQR